MLTHKHFGLAVSVVSSFDKNEKKKKKRFNFVFVLV